MLRGKEDAMDRHAGITLIELLTAIALIAVLAGIAVPALDRILLNARRNAVLEDVARAAWLARSEALRRGRPVLLCGSRDGRACAGELPAWDQGWLVVPEDEPARVLRLGAGAAHPRGRLLANRHSFRFEPGERRSTNGTLAWCDDRGDAAARALVISPTGRPRRIRGAGSLECAPR